MESYQTGFIEENDKRSKEMIITHNPSKSEVDMVQGDLDTIVCAVHIAKENLESLVNGAQELCTKIVPQSINNIPIKYEIRIIPFHTNSFYPYLDIQIYVSTIDDKVSYGFKASTVLDLVPDEYINSYLPAYLSECENCLVDCLKKIISELNSMCSKDTPKFKPEIDYWWSRSEQKEGTLYRCRRCGYEVITTPELIKKHKYCSNCGAHNNGIVRN